MEIPKVVTHRYDPARGAGLNICSLSDFEASCVLDHLRQGCRPTLKPNYLARRRETEEWLARAVKQVLKRTVARQPRYFFLGDFSFHGDPSRPAALVIPLASLPVEAVTFTLGDSMTAVEEPRRRVYNFAQMVELFGDDDAVARSSLSNRSGFQTHFIEVQLWDGLVCLA
jgi:hypothetical protein